MVPPSRIGHKEEKRFGVKGKMTGMLLNSF